MPPNKTSTSHIGLTASNVAVIRSALLNLKTAFDPDWEAVRSEIGIRPKNNAHRDFRQAMAKLDLTLLKGKIVSTANTADEANTNAKAEDGNDDGAAAAATKAAKGTKRKANHDSAEGTKVKIKKAKKAEKEDSAEESDGA